MKHFGRRLHDRTAIPFAAASAAAGALTALVAVSLLAFVAAHAGDFGAFRLGVQLMLLWCAAMTAGLVAFAWRQRARMSERLRSFASQTSRAAAGEDDGVVREPDPELADLARSVARMGESLRDRTDSLSRKVEEISTLREVGRAGRSGELRLALDAVLAAAVRAVPADRAYIVLSHANGHPFVAASLGGMPAPGADASVSAPAAWVLANGRSLVLNPDGSGATQLADPLAIAVAAVAVPVPGSEGPLGALVLGSTFAADTYTTDDVRMLSAIGDQAALAVENARLVENLQESYLATVRSLAAAIEARDAYTRGHSDRVAAHAAAIAQELGLAEEQRIALEVASYLHDIGKIGIPEAILGKPGRLDEAEFSRMKDHVNIGAGILGQVSFPWPVAPVVRHHHERWDGGGYPTGLAGEDIPLLARIVTVADSYEAMTSDRPYRAACPTAFAVDELRRHAGAQFDARVVAAFERALRRAGVYVDESVPAETAAPASVFGAGQVAEPAFG